MIRRGAKNLENIVTANLNYYSDLFGTLPEDQKDEAQRRLAICTNCPFNSKNSKFLDTEGGEHSHYDSTRTDEHCTACGCPIEKKIFSFNEKCGLSYLTELKTVRTFNQNNYEITELTSVHDPRNGHPLVYNWKPLWLEYNTNKQ